MSNQSWVLPKVSAHIMRHTACTRMAEKRMDVKVLQYIMGTRPHRRNDGRIQSCK